MKVTKLTILTLLLISVLFFMLNGCDTDNENDSNGVVNGPSEILRVVPGKELAVGTAGEITDIKFHDQWIVVSNLFEIQIYKDRGDKLQASLTGHPGIVETVALSEDSQGSFFIAAGCSDGTIRIWNAKTVKEKLGTKQSSEVLIFAKENEDYYRDIKDAHAGGVKTVVFSNKDKKLLASRDGSPDIKLWNVGELWDIQLEAPTIDAFKVIRELEGAVSALVFSDDGNDLVNGTAREAVKIRNPNSGDTKTIFDDDKNVNVEITALAFFPGNRLLDMEGRFLAGARSDSKILLWNIRKKGTGLQDSVKEFTLNNAVITALAFLSHSSLLVAGTNDGEIYAWDMNNIAPEGKPSGYFQEPHHSSITALASSTEGTFLASGSADGIIHISAKNEPLHPFE